MFPLHYIYSIGEWMIVLSLVDCPFKLHFILLCGLLVIGFQPNQPQLTLLWFHFTSSLFNKSIIFVWIKLRKKVEWKRLIDGMRAGKEIYNPLRRNLKLMELILMKAAALSISLQSIISFHNKRKLNFSFFVSFNNWFYEIDWMELKKYYNSKLII